MDLMTLVAKIALDDSDYVKGIRGAEKSGKSLASRMSAMTVAMGNLATDVIRKGISSINSVVSGAMDGYANYQQLVGGVETLFKTSANKVANYAKQSYKTTGLSANQYMETVTSFSASLLQGLGGDTDRAADMANMAVTDMADNANKMGTDIGSIQVAYQGFAKKNYTMLDNLKLGYGGTAAEMIRLVNDSKILDHEITDLDGITFDQLVQAIHVVQTNLGITGTTAQEAADTISGSKNSLAAAWSDLLVAVAGTDSEKTTAYNDPLNDALENFQTSFSTFIENMVPTLVRTVANSGSLVTAIANAIGDLPADLLATVADAGVDAAPEAVKGVSKITSWLINSIGEMFKSAKEHPDKIKDLGTAIGDFIGTAISDIAKNAPDMINGIIDAGVALAGGLIEGLWQGLFGTGAEVDDITDQLNDDLTDIDLKNAKATGILNYMDSLYDKYGKGVKRTEDWKNAQKQLEEVLPAAGQVFKNYGSDIQSAIDDLKTLNESMKRTAIISGLNKALREQYELLGEQQAKQSTAEVKAEMARTQQDEIRSRVLDSIMAYAEASQGRFMAGSDEEAALNQLLQNGTVSIGNETRNLTDLDFEQLLSIAHEYGSLLELANLNGEETPVWDENAFDNVYSPDELESFVSTYTGLQNDIDSALADAASAQKEVEQTQKQISLTEAATERAISQQAQSYTTAADGVNTGGAMVEGALTGLAGRIDRIGMGSYMPKAVGIDYVPTNGFRAELHKGEAVLTASENAAYRSGNTNAMVEELRSLRSDMRNLKLVVGKKTFGQAVVDYGGNRMDNYIGGANSRVAAGYGT
jgi:hypothetical protein